MSTPTITFIPREVHSVDTESGLTDVVKRVEWEFHFTSEGHTSVGSGVTILPEPSPEDYIPVSGVTKEDLKNWVVETHGGDVFLDQILEFHQHQLAEKAVMDAASSVDSLEEPPVKTEEELKEEDRMERDIKLREADIAIFKAEDNGEPTATLRAYRQALRDVPQQGGFPDNVSWPSKPV